jgi:hypothetical protein
MRKEKAVSDICYLKFFVCIDGIQLAKSLDKKICDSLSVIYGRSAFFSGFSCFSTNKTDRHYRTENVVESGVKHHNP